MQSNYKRLGDFIQEVNVRNRDLIETPLLGVSVKKVFIPSIANTVGTDFSKYKIVKRNQFTYIPDTSRRGDKIGLALLDSHEAALVSQAYTVFKVIDEQELLPEYLMMWFRRPEFDRYARVKSHGSVREIFGWDEMCEVELPIPTIEKQREIVREYNIIQNRINLNNQLIAKLEETAQAIYKQWFVDFEFPNENNLPYKSNGGEMVWCEELEKEIPKGWECKSFTKIIKLSGGGTPDTTNSNFWNGSIPFFTPADVGKSYYTIATLKNITDQGLKGSSTKLYPKNTVFVTARGTVGAISISSTEMAMNQSCYAITPINKMSNYFIHQLTLDAIEKLKKEAVGAVFSALVTKDFDEQNLIKPSELDIQHFDKTIKPIYNSILNKCRENYSLNELTNLILAKMTKVESEIEVIAN